MKSIILALFLFSVSCGVKAADLIGRSGPAWNDVPIVLCNGCPEKSHQEKFVDDLAVEDAGVIVVWNEDKTPKHIVITSNYVAPVQDVCETFKKYWDGGIQITTHAGGINQYWCEGDR